MAIYISNKKYHLNKITLRIINPYLIYLALLILLFIISFINYSFFNNGDFSFIEQQIKNIAQIFISFIFLPIVITHIISKLTIKQTFTNILYFFIFLALLSLLQLSNESFRMWYLDITALNGYWYEWAQKSTRAIGLKAMSIWDTSIAYSLFVFVGFSVVYINKVKENIYSNVKLYMFFTVISLLVIISGRTGLLLLIGFMLLLSIIHKTYKYLFFIVILIFILSLFIILSIDNEVLIRVINFSFELFINLLQGNIETNSTNDLINNHLFFPDINNIYFGDNIFIGDGDQVISKIGKSSDSAFVINYAAYGVTGFFITVFLMFINAYIFLGFFSLQKKNLFYYIVLLICVA
ncbi:hypothetical protein, partial [Providencia heimbachae]|uniref:hypothetical protein n=1 Tax=Providencia heimbachae TaxID=333962 RepID=UPI00223EBCF4